MELRQSKGSVWKALLEREVTMAPFIDLSHPGIGAGTARRNRVK
jgi:hypothetical protein